jgi:pyruvate kinase
MNLPPKRKVKIICTLGPSCHPTTLSGMIDAGMDLARFNFSHGTQAFHQHLMDCVRKEAIQKNQSIGTLQDLRGPKLRLGALIQDVELEPGEKVVLYPEGNQAPSSNALPIDHNTARLLLRYSQKKAKLLFNDGQVQGHIQKIKTQEIHVEIEKGGWVGSHKGINIPGSSLPMPCLTRKDLEDLKFGLREKVDMIALSFVQSPKDIQLLRKKIKSFSNWMPLLVTKIEREEALDCLDSILNVSEAILIARGDMAVEIGAQRVPFIQKKIIHACNLRGLPVITATQMLESMIHTSAPTRAEASDVANAVWDGTDAVMLSGETATGKYPVEAVKTMAQIILEAEKTPYTAPTRTSNSTVEAIEKSAAQIALDIQAKAIACFTHSGQAAITLAKYRPKTPIVAITDQASILRRLSAVWGIRGIVIPKLAPTDALLELIIRALKDHGWVKDRDQIVITAGIPTLKRATTNMIQVHRIGDSKTRKFEFK